MKHCSCLLYESCWNAKRSKCAMCMHLLNNSVLKCRVDKYIQYFWFLYLLIAVAIDLKWLILKFVLTSCKILNSVYHSIGYPHLHI